VAVNDRLLTGCPGLVYDKSMLPVVVMILTMTAGTGAIMWLGELITERGVGNGMSVLIFTQIAATFPSALWSLKVARPGSQGWVVFLLVIGLGLLVMLGGNLRRAVTASDPRAVRQTDGGAPGGYWSASSIQARVPSCSSPYTAARRIPFCSLSRAIASGDCASA
jgi:hypothetical protein